MSWSLQDYLSHLADRTSELEAAAADANKEMSDVNKKVLKAREERKKLEKEVNDEVRRSAPRASDSALIALTLEAKADDAMHDSRVAYILK